MNTMILGLLAETSIHPGAGGAAGLVDLPVAREAATDYPVIVGSSFKGALRETARQDEQLQGSVEQIFGKQESAGDLLVADARLLLLPVRSLDAPFRWITCPHLLERCQRDLHRAGHGKAMPVKKIGVARGQCLSASGKDHVYLEERRFDVAGAVPEPVSDALGHFVAHEPTRERLHRQLTILADEDFAWFARYGLTVTARNRLDEIKKTSKNLWYEETLPPDSLFYALLAERADEALSGIRSLFARTPYVRVGGNETVGQGWFAVQVYDQSRGARDEEAA